MLSTRHAFLIETLFRYKEQRQIHHAAFYRPSVVEVWTLYCNYYLNYYFIEVEDLKWIMFRNNFFNITWNSEYGWNRPAISFFILKLKFSSNLKCNRKDVFVLCQILLVTTLNWSNSRSSRSSIHSLNFIISSMRLHLLL